MAILWNKWKRNLPVLHAWKRRHGGSSFAVLRRQMRARWSRACCRCHPMQAKLSNWLRRSRYNESCHGPIDAQDPAAALDCAAPSATRTGTSGGRSFLPSTKRLLCLSALQMAFVSRQPPLGLSHHTDRGIQYAREEYQAALLAFVFVGSMSRKGNCRDHAVAESFFATLKAEHCNHQRFATRAAACQAIFKYIEVFYNRERLHYSLGYRSPTEYESLHTEALNAA